MNGYIPNRTCPCPRCRARGLMGAAVLITLGVLFLLNEFSNLRFHESFPVLFIVIGLVMYLGRSAPIEGHVQPPLPAGAVAPPPPPSPPADSQGPEVHP
jgi:hypothetical protein